MTQSRKATKQDNSLSDVVMPPTGNDGLTQDQKLYNEVLDVILDGRLKPGVKLKEDELADIFSVSRTVVRRALLKLAHDRIVNLQPNRGATVIHHDVRQAKEILGVRRLIEGAIIQQATAAATKKDLDKLRLCVKAEQDQVRRKKFGTGLRLSGDFHIQLAMLAKNETLLNYLKELVPQTSLIISLYQIPNHDLCSHEEHFTIIDAIASGDKAKAQAVMDKHLQHIEDKLDLNEERSGDDLYAAFAHVKECDS